MRARNDHYLQKLGTIVGIIGGLVGIVSTLLKGGPVLIFVVVGVALVSWIIYEEMTDPAARIAIGVEIGLALGATGVTFLLQS